MNGTVAAGRSHMYPSPVPFSSSRACCKSRIGRWNTYRRREGTARVKKMFNTTHNPSPQITYVQPQFTSPPTPRTHSHLDNPPLPCFLLHVPFPEQQIDTPAQHMFIFIFYLPHLPFRVPRASRPRPLQPRPRHPRHLPRVTCPRLPCPPARCTKTRYRGRTRCPRPGNLG